MTKEGAMAHVRRIREGAAPLTNPISKLLDTLVPGRALYRSMTVWGLALYFGAETFVNEACEMHLMSFHTCQWWLTVLQSSGVVLTALGIRRAVVKGPSQ